jgi:hypothetical protein
VSLERRAWEGTRTPDLRITKALRVVPACPLASRGIPFLLVRMGIGLESWNEVGYTWTRWDAIVGPDR